MKKLLLLFMELFVSVLTFAQTPIDYGCLVCGEKAGKHKSDCIYASPELLDNMFSISAPTADEPEADSFVVDFKNKKQVLMFKDAAIKRCALEQWDKNNDGKLTVAEAKKATELQLMFPNRKDMFVINCYDDLRFFPNLKYRDAGKAWHVDVLDLSHNPKLKEVNLENCQEIATIILAKGCKAKLKYQAFGDKKGEVVYK